VSPQHVSYAAADNDSAFDIDPIIERLAALRTADDQKLFRQVRGAADLAAIEQITSFTPPEAFVVLMIERGKPSAGNTRQAMTAAFSVVLVARNYAYQQGKAAADALKPLKHATRNAIAGWIPNRDNVAALGARACVWQQGGVVDYSAGTIVWSDIYLGQQNIGSRPQ
jgi:hypothetical protein